MLLLVREEEGRVEMVGEEDEDGHDGDEEFD